MLFSAYTLHFLSETSLDATCNIEESKWVRLHDENPSFKRHFAKISFEGATAICALGTPVRSDITGSNYDNIFLPPWILRILNCDGYNDTVEIEWLSEETFCEATRIVLRPKDSAFFSVNAKEELERALTQFGILKTGTTIPVKIVALDNYEIMFDVLELEPANIVLLQGDEVEIEFAGEEVPVVKEPTDFTEMISSEPRAQIVDTPVGNQLGGNNRARDKDGRAWNPWR